MNVIDSTDLYVVWVDPGRQSDEQAPRTALHVQATP